LSGAGRNSVWDRQVEKTGILECWNLGMMGLKKPVFKRI